MDKQRNRHLAAIHAIKKKIGMDDDIYRGVLAARYGQQSAGKLSASDLADCAAHFKSLTSNRPRGKSPRSRNKAEKTMIDKARALWIDASKRGLLRNGSDQALNAFSKRITKVDRLEWLNPSQQHRVVESLKSWISRLEAEANHE